MTTKLDLESFKKLLLQERERLESERRTKAEEHADLGEELADYDDHHPADTASETYERTKDYAIDENFREMVEQIDSALRKIEDGSYGLCDRCGDPINRARLSAIPSATLCIKCQETIERQ